MQQYSLQVLQSVPYAPGLPKETILRTNDKYMVTILTIHDIKIWLKYEENYLA